MDKLPTLEPQVLNEAPTELERTVVMYLTGAAFGYSRFLMVEFYCKVYGCGCCTVSDDALLYVKLCFKSVFTFGVVKHCMYMYTEVQEFKVEIERNLLNLTNIWENKAPAPSKPLFEHNYHKLNSQMRMTYKANSALMADSFAHGCNIMSAFIRSADLPDAFKQATTSFKTGVRLASYFEAPQEVKTATPPPGLPRFDAKKTIPTPEELSFIA